MSGERLLASYIVRILVRAGKRSIALHNIKTGEVRNFGSYRELLEHLGNMEETLTQVWPRPDDAEGSS